MENTHLTSVPESGKLFEIDGFTAQLCLDEESKTLAYRLRYESYIKVDGIEPNEEELMTDGYDLSPNARVHLIWYQGRPVASVRSTTWSAAYDWLAPESIQSFWNDVHRTIGLHQNIIESARYIVAPDIGRKHSMFAQLLMFRILDLCSQVDYCRYIITSVRERHVPFYKRMLGFEQISEPIRHKVVKANIVLLSTTQHKSRSIAERKGMPSCSPEEVERYAKLVEPFKMPSHAR